MQQKKTNSYSDSVRNWARAYQDSIAIDYDAKEMRYIYIHKDDKDSYKGGVKDNNGVASAQWQFTLVPLFFAIMLTLLIFAFILYRDNKIGMSKKYESILTLIKKK